MIKIFILVLVPIFPIMAQSFGFDSLATSDSLAYLKYQGLNPKTVYPYQGSTQLNYQHQSQFRGTLKLGRPYQPTQEVIRMDLRGSSFYTPQFAYDKHQMDMGRDPGTFWVSPVSIALLAVAMADRLFLREMYSGWFKTRPFLIDDAIFAGEHWQILSALWERSPQTINELRKNPSVGFRYPGEKLDLAMEELVETQLINVEKLPGNIVDYRPGFSRDELKEKMLEMLDDPLNGDPVLRDNLQMVLEKYYE